MNRNEIPKGFKSQKLTTTGGGIYKGLKREWHWECYCSCGSDKKVFVRSSGLIKGLIKSCGCANNDNRNTSGLGIGRPEKCLICSKSFTQKGPKQFTCSDDCRYLSYQGSGDGCWVWSGPSNTSGYGVLSLSSAVKKIVSAHRYAYEKYKGEIPEDLCVMHTCDNRLCTNPAHLVTGTWADNNADRSAKGRSGSRKFTNEEREAYSLSFRGSGNAMAKLNEDQAREIKYNTSLGCVLTARKYGISKSIVVSIRAGKSWSHV